MPLTGSEYEESPFCPVCESEDVYRSAVTAKDAEVVGVVRYCKCLSCESSWKERLKPWHYEDLEDNWNPNPEE